MNGKDSIVSMKMALWFKITLDQLNTENEDHFLYALFF